MKILIIALLATTLAGCTIPVKLNPPIADTKITKLCIIDNPKVLMSGFLPELKAQIQRHGIETLTYSGYNPTACQHWLTYTANWRWKLWMDMSYANLNLYDRTALIGSATFENPEFGYQHHGPAAGKLKILTDSLFAGNNQ